MVTAKFTPEEAVEEAVSILWTGPNAPGQEVIRKWIQKAVESAKKAEESEKLDSEHLEALVSIQKHAGALLRALESMAKLAPWASEDETGDLYPMSDILPVGNPYLLTLDLRSLADLGKPLEGSLYDGARCWMIKSGPLSGHRVHLQLPAKKTTHPRMADQLLKLHEDACCHLKKCGISPVVGTGGNVANLGALYCVAAGVSLQKGESTKAARLAHYQREMTTYKIGVRTVNLSLDETSTTVRNADGPFKPMWTHCSILPNLDS